jgi:predicted dehydrogenase
VAVAEPIAERRISFARQHQIARDQQYEHWRDLLAEPQNAHGALICTQDHMHAEPTIAALRGGYDVLLEKPIATTPEDCVNVIKSAAETGRQLHIGHVLRYTPHFQLLHKILRSGELGDIINVAHRENVSWWHMAHSYVRGSWAVRAQSSPMILTKCCHDFDLLVWTLQRRCEHLSSVGDLVHFRPENGPPGATHRCLDRCPAGDDCPYYAPFIYLDLFPLWRDVANTSAGLVKFTAEAQLRTPKLINIASKAAPSLRLVSEYRGWPRSVLALEPTDEAVLAALREGPYGRCVYFCENDVVDHQVVLMQFEGGLSVSLTMHGHSHNEGRSTRIEGSRAELKASFGLGGSWIEVVEHRTDRRTRYDTSNPVRGAHGGGDEGLLYNFVQQLRDGNHGGVQKIAHEALYSHLLAFAADKARLENRVIDIDTFNNHFISHGEDSNTWATFGAFH